MADVGLSVRAVACAHIANCISIYYLLSDQSGRGPPYFFPSNFLPLTLTRLCPILCFMLPSLARRPWLLQLLRSLALSALLGLLLVQSFFDAGASPTARSTSSNIFMLCALGFQKFFHSVTANVTHWPDSAVPGPEVLCFDHMFIYTSLFKTVRVGNPDRVGCGHCQ